MSSNTENEKINETINTYQSITPSILYNKIEINANNINAQENVQNEEEKIKTKLIKKIS